jgi:hypothetical protein
MKKGNNTIDQESSPNPIIGPGIYEKKVDIMAEFIESSIKNAQRKQEAMAASDVKQQ